MQVFKDCNGKDWLVQIDPPQIKLVRAKLNNADGKPLDLYRLVEGKMTGLEELLGDPILLVDTLFILCSKQAEKDKVTDEDFGRAMFGDAIGRGANAFMEALIDFFPDEKTRRNLRMVTKKGKELTDLMRAEEMKRLENFDLQAELKKRMPPRDSQQPNGSSTSVQESAESIPTAPAEPSAS